MIRNIQADRRTMIMASQASIYSEALPPEVRDSLFFAHVFCAENGFYPTMESMMSAMRTFNNAAEALANATYISPGKTAPWAGSGTPHPSRQEGNQPHNPTEGHMLRIVKRVLFLLPVVAVSMAVTSTPSGAALVDIGEVCFQAGGDTIRAQTQSSANIATINFRWRSFTFYEILGTASASTLQPGFTILAISGLVANPAGLAGSTTCSLVATLNPPNFNGPFNLLCTGGDAPITATGNIFPVGCTPAM